VSIAALAAEPVVLVKRDVEPTWADASSRAIAGTGYTLNVLQETDTKLALLGLIAAGLGVSPVSTSMRHLERRGVVFRDLTGLALELPLVVISTREPSPRAREVLELAANCARARPRAPRA